MILASDKIIMLLKEKLSIDENVFQILEPFRDIFIENKHNFSDYFYNFFLNIPETAMFLKHYEMPGFLKKAWSEWFEVLFSWQLDSRFMDYLWKIGKRHVEVNLDQRFSNLGFAVVRQFCEQIILSEVPKDKVPEVFRAFNKLIDFCLLVETNAYIKFHARCDIEIIKGIADRIRNKITVIGGNIKLLQKKIDANDPLYEIYSSLITDSSVCEHMVLDIRSFIDMSQREAIVEEIQIEDLINKTLELLDLKSKKDIKVEIALDKKSPVILADSKDLQMMFYHLIQNSIEALDKEPYYIRISSTTDKSMPNRVKIEIFNTGTPPKTEYIERLFSPFFTTKPFGTGFGLAIAKLAIKKNYGRLLLEPVQEKGTRVIVILPSPS